MGWSYGLGKVGNAFYLCEIIIPDDKRKTVWGHRIGWVELLKHPIMVISDLLDQKKHIASLFNIELLEKDMKRYFSKITKGL